MCEYRDESVLVASMVRAKPTLPNLIIIGAAKCGTTSLHNHLALHPDIFMSKKKELYFFDGLTWDRGLDWYKSNFDASYPINGESSTRYTHHPLLPGVPQKIKRYLGTPKLIYVLRDPVERILSNYTQNVDDWPNTPPFDQLLPCIEQATAGYVQVSSYFHQLSEYLKVFPRESILVLVSERFSAQPRETLRRVFRFIGVNDNFWMDEFARRANAGEGKRAAGEWFANYAPQSLKDHASRRDTGLHWRAKQALYRISRIGGEPIPKPDITEEDDARLQDLLKADVAALKDLLNDPLPEWRPYK
jgi:hypothetical protein